jgi:arylsulfatase
MRNKFIAMVSAVLLVVCSSESQSDAQSDAQSNLVAQPTADRPNFLIIVADDMGWSDMGAFGGEIKTPNLDALATRGAMMTSFYVGPTCSPTRAMLMTGIDNHTAGVGTMAGFNRPNQLTQNYQGQLHNDVVTLSEGLKAADYTTLMSGKWHLAKDEKQQPNVRGFDKSFTMDVVIGSHFGNGRPLHGVEGYETDVVRYIQDGESVEVEDDFYSSIDFTEKLLTFLDEKNDEKPFFAYLAFTAPHDPLQVPDEWLNKYAGVYDAGPKAIQQARLENLKAKGLVAEGQLLWELPNFPPSLPLHERPWQERSEAERAQDTRPMEIYASMIELMDAQIGRIIQKLADEGQLENTYIMFFSDNGASLTTPLIYPGNSIESVKRDWPDTHSAPGTRHAFSVMGREWANVSNTPWRGFKAEMAEGGIRSPFVVAGPGIEAGTRIDDIGHVMDILPTLYSLTGFNPETSDLYKGKIQPQGVSLDGLWDGTQTDVRQSFGVEFFGRKGFRNGDWKITTLATHPKWQLFNMAVDPGEKNDLAETHPDILQALIKDYEAYAELNGVIPPKPALKLNPRFLYADPCDTACEQKFTDFMKRQKQKNKAAE